MQRIHNRSSVTSPRRCVLLLYSRLNWLQRLPETAATVSTFISVTFNCSTSVQTFPVVFHFGVEMLSPGTLMYTNSKLKRTKDVLDRDDDFPQQM